jgi:hypothetical protein
MINCHREVGGIDARVPHRLVEDIVLQVSVGLHLSVLIVISGVAGPAKHIGRPLAS